MKAVLSLFQFTSILFLSITISQCASEPPVQIETKITVYNSGTISMQNPMACYYQETDIKKCTIIDSTVGKIASGQSQTFTIKANQKVRLIFPFDEIIKVSNVVYRPNCHILSDFFAFEEKNYFADAQIIANLSKPENGFNCALTMFEQNKSETSKALMDENATNHIRYRVPRKDEIKEGYISNYNWQ
jgi:hypothetical protein